MEKEDLAKFVNQIFKKKGYAPIKLAQFASAFADGIQFELLFNIMYDEKISCNLVPSALVEDRILNWNRINCKWNFIFEILPSNYFSDDLLQLPSAEVLLSEDNDDVSRQRKEPRGYFQAHQGSDQHPAVGLWVGHRGRHRWTQRHRRWNWDVWLIIQRGRAESWPSSRQRLPEFQRGHLETSWLRGR